MIKKTSMALYWSPRILSIGYILFLMVFSLDVFEPGRGAYETLIGLLIHNIPSFVLAVVLAISWRHELFGAIVYFLVTFLNIIFAMQNAPNALIALSWSMFIAGPALLNAILFLLCYLR